MNYYKDFDKAKAVMRSCRTKDHAATARIYIELFRRRYSQVAGIFCLIGELRNELRNAMEVK